MAVYAPRIAFTAVLFLCVGTTSGYISLENQLDQLYHDINAGKFGADAKTGEWFVGITSVKTSFPKPS